MKKRFGFGLLALLVMVVLVGNACADDDNDKYLCRALVTWQGEVVCGAEADNSIREAKRDAIEEACERICKDNDVCENECEKNAQFVYECKDRANKVVESEGELKNCVNDTDTGCCKDCSKWGSREPLAMETLRDVDKIVLLSDITLAESGLVDFEFTAPGAKVADTKTDMPSDKDCGCNGNSGVEKGDKDAAQDNGVKKDESNAEAKMV